MSILAAYLALFRRMSHMAPQCASPCEALALAGALVLATMPLLVLVGWLVLLVRA